MSDAVAPLREGDLLTVPQALRLLPIGKTLLYDLIREGQIPAYEFRALGSRRPRYAMLRSDLERFVATRRVRRAPVRPGKVYVDALLAKVRGGGRPA